MKNLFIFGYKVLLEVSNKKTESVFIIPGNNKNEPQLGKVVLIGDGKVDDKIMPIDLNIGDLVYFFPWNSQQIDLDNKSYYLVKYNDLIGKENK